MRTIILGQSNCDFAFAKVSWDKAVVTPLDRPETGILAKRQRPAL
jgi:hypothetical protein